MKRTVSLMVSLMVAAWLLSTVAASALTEDLIPFNSASAAVQNIGGTWRIVADGVILKNFGANKDDAYRALAVIQYYKINVQGFVGRPNPPLEYYLVDNHAPRGAMDGENAVEFDPAKVRAERTFMFWNVVLKPGLSLPFGVKKSEAQAAVQIIQKYGFNHYCTVGTPKPTFTYFRCNAKFINPGSLGPLSPHLPALEFAEDCISFNPDTTTVALIGGNYKVVDGSHWILDFGSKKSEAEKALATIKYYKMNSICFVGRPGLKMSYFLVDGKAPRGPMQGEDAIGFNPATIEAKLVNGTWKVVDGNHWMLDFGDKQDQANMAVSIIRKYGFNHICYVGRPNAPMMYFRCDLLLLNPGQIGPYLPGLALKEDCLSFNPDTVSVAFINNRYKLVDGNHWILDFADKKTEAYRALEIVKHYGMNSICFVGRPDPSMTYFLVNGSSPTGALSGEDAISFNPATAEVKQIGGRWKVVDGNNWLLDFNDKQAEANTALSIIRKYGFTRLCFVGRPDPSMEYLRK